VKTTVCTATMCIPLTTKQTS